ncbi:hypothetical protein EXN66_Car001932 [Channa argus]|uniref:Fibronectin type-III domain-containing protein n=1 Tax=Channa argus TaxID=215402 RepID=A0A6G1P7I3_CHAAH|nr:hypothetical protein EXN66_Car001932 [Channa argus]
MDFNRRIGGAVSFILLILGNAATVLALTGVNMRTSSDLECTNDYEKVMCCQFDAQNCSEYNLTLVSNNGYGEKRCTFHECDAGCCCSVSMMLVTGETHNATVWKGDRVIESQTVDITSSIKPKTPTIVSVIESNGNFKVRWKTNHIGAIASSLAANVTYYKKGDTQKVSTYVEQATVDGLNGLNFYEILGRHLEPSTTYVVSVRSYTTWSGRFSDSSTEEEFTTAASYQAVLLVIIISLSILSVVITGAMYGCYVKYKTKWWDAVLTPNLYIYPTQHEFCKPDTPIMSSVFVKPRTPDETKSCSTVIQIDTGSESPQHSSGISTGSSSLSYANTEPVDVVGGVQDALSKVLPNISPILPWNTGLLLDSNKDISSLSVSFNSCGVGADSSGSSGFDNKTYSILLPSCPQEFGTDSSEVQTLAKMVCDTGYHPSEGGTVICVEQQVPPCPVFSLPLVASSVLPTDMSYQQCKADSAYAEDSSLSSVSSGSHTIDPVSRVEAGCETADEVGESEEAMVCDENPCYGCVPAVSHGHPTVEDDYQAFQNLVGRPCVLFPEQDTEQEECLHECPEGSVGKVPLVIPGFFHNVPVGQCLSQLQRPLVPLTSAHQPIPVITESGYQRV